MRCRRNRVASLPQGGVGEPGGCGARAWEQKGLVGPFLPTSCLISAGDPGWGSKPCPKAKSCPQGPLPALPGAAAATFTHSQAVSWSRSDNCMRTFLIIPQRTCIHLEKTASFASAIPSQKYFKEENDFGFLIKVSNTSQAGFILIFLLHKSFHCV